VFRIALLTARGRPGTFAGAFLVFAVSAVLVMAGGMLLQAALSTHAPVERYAAAAAVVTGQQNVGEDGDVVLGERARVDAGLAERLAAVPGVRAAIADVAVPARVDGRDTEAHGWSSAQLAPYALTAGQAPAGAGEVVTTYPAKIGSRLTFSSTETARTVTVVGVARPRRPVTRDVVFVSDAEAARLAGHPGTVDAIGVLPGPGFEASRVRAVAGKARVLTGDERGKAEALELEAGHVRLIAVAASFGGLGLFIALFAVAGTMSLAVQQREQEIGLLRAIAATPRQIRRMITGEATLIALVGSAAGLWPGMQLGRELAEGLGDHGIAPPSFVAGDTTVAAAGVVAGSILVALLAVWAAGRRASRIAPTRALAEAAVEPRLIGRGRLIGGLVAIAGAVPLFSVAASTTNPATAAATSELTAIFLVTAAGCLGPVVSRVMGRALQPLVAAISPVGGFLATSNVVTASRRFSSATTPIVLTVALSATLLFSSTTIDHAVSSQRDAGLASDLAVSSAGAGLAPSALAAVRATRGVDSAVAITPTTLGPSLGVSDDPISAAVVAGGAGGGLDVDVTSGSLAGLHGAAIALSTQRADAIDARVGARVPVTLGDGTPTHARVVAIFTRALAFGDALVAPELVSGHQTSPLLSTILVSSSDQAATAGRLGALAAQFPGLRVGDRAALAGADDVDRQVNHWMGPLFVLIIFVFSSIAVVNTLVMIGLRRGRELALLQLTGATRRQVRAMARWESALIVAIGIGVGLAIAATALLPLSHALTGGLQPHIPPGQLAAILGGSAVIALVALALPTRRAMRVRPIAAVRTAE
jgi:putative ABC transport system permease protein